MSRFAQIRLGKGSWDVPRSFMPLRAAHHLAQFHGVTEIRLDVPEVPKKIFDAWTVSLQMRHRNLSFRFGCPAAEDLPLFAAPDFPVRMENSGEIRLGIPEIPDLTDFHVHTGLAYCSENMSVSGAMEMERVSGVKFVNFSEHSGQLFHPPELYWSNRFLRRDLSPAFDRTELYEKLARENPGAERSFGLELDVDNSMWVSDFSSPSVGGVRLGAVHFLRADLTPEERKTEFMRKVDALLENGIRILAHPFRVFLRAGMPVPEELFEPLSEKLVRAGVAAEINFHTNSPREEFIAMLLKKGGKISFGTDSHHLYEAGWLLPHFEFCKRIGVAGRLDEVLLSAKSAGVVTKTSGSSQAACGQAV